MNIIKYAESPEYTQMSLLCMLRRISSISIEDVASGTNLSRSMISLLETGQRPASSEQIKSYSDFLRTKLKFKIDLYEAVKELSHTKKITDVKYKEDPIDLFYSFLKECYKTRRRKKEE